MKDLEARCPACNQEVTFEYIGKQEILDKEPLDAYNCSNCKSTCVSSSIEKYNKEN